MLNSKPLHVFKAPLTGISLVEASAGTGKTYNITSLYIRAILELNLQPAQILVMTFTEAATAELKSRLRTRLKEAQVALEINDAGEDAFLQQLLQQNYPNAVAKMKSAITEFDEAAVFTIHGFCNRVLGEHSLLFDVPPHFELLTDESELLQDCVDDRWRELMQSADTNDLDWFTLDYLTDDGFGPDDLRKVIEEVFKHPRSKVVPDQLSRVDLSIEIDRLRSTFERLKHLWEKDKDEISDMYLNGKLHGTYFKSGSNSWKEDWQNLLDLMESKVPKIKISDRMDRFGSYMRDKGSKSSFEVPDLGFFKQMDAYVELTEKLSFLKPAFISESIDEIKANFEQQKRSANVLTYNDLLDITESGLVNDQEALISKKLSEKYPLALVDEFQDTDPVQYTIFRKIYFGRKGTGLFMIGDPKQAIYGFRGADIFTYLTARADVSEDQTYHLLHNYRSNKGMIHGVNDLFSQADNSFLLQKLAFKSASYPEGKSDKTYLTKNSGEKINPLQFITLNDQEYSRKPDINQDIYEVISTEILHLLSGEFLLKGKKVKEKDIAILVRQGTEGEAIQSALREKGISSVLRSRSSVYKTKEAEELLRILSAIQKMSYEPGIRAALGSSLLGYSAEELLALNNDEQQWSDLIQRFSAIKEKWEIFGIDAAIGELFDAFKILERLSKEKAAERRISNLYHLSELLSKAVRDQKLDPKSLLKWFYSKVNEDGDNASLEDEELRLESDEALVQITTMHSSKGLEYPIVFCPFLWNSRSSTDKNSILKFYHNDQIHIDISQNISHADKDEYRAVTEHQSRAEDVRLTYVALTRAVSACFVILPKYKQIKDSPLAYILNGDRGMGKYSNFDAIAEVIGKASELKIRKPLTGEIESDPDKNNDKVQLEAAEFKRSNIFQFPRMLSYSSLSGAKEHSETGKDYDEFVSVEIEEEREDQNDRFGFPKGANAGTCLHMIFEDLRFYDSQNMSEVVEKNLEYYGIDKRWIPIAVQWVAEVLSHTLLEPAIALKNISEPQLLKEMEFFFPVEPIEPGQLWSFIRPEQELSTNDLDLVHGFMKGFIDLIFEHDGKYYILDYKSNHLGNELTDYRPEKLQQAMLDSGYDLQYHIYTLALHRYLSVRMSDYSYEKHFGGAIYLYLRGVDSETPGSGVFYHKPDMQVIKKLDDYFKGGN